MRHVEFRVGCQAEGRPLVFIEVANHRDLLVLEDFDQPLLGEEPADESPLFVLKLLHGECNIVVDAKRPLCDGPLRDAAEAQERVVLRAISDRQAVRFGRWFGVIIHSF